MGYTRLEYLRKTFKPGDIIECVEMKDAYGVPPGTRGKVDYVDDYGNIHMIWENGSKLSLIEEWDSFIRIVE